MLNIDWVQVVTEGEVLRGKNKTEPCRCRPFKLHCLTWNLEIAFNTYLTEKHQFEVNHSYKGKNLIKY